MLKWILLFLIIALVAAVIAFGGISGIDGNLAEIVFYIFISLFFISVIRDFTH
ncbi:MAG: DUF1328 domain-containing protein [Leeuwenhoekiella sp.]